MSDKSTHETREVSVRRLAERLLIQGLPPLKAYATADEFIAIGEQRCRAKTRITDSIESLGLSARAVNAAKSYGVTEIGQLISMTADDLQSWRNCGAVTAAEIVQKVLLAGYSMRRSVPRERFDEPH